MKTMARISVAALLVAAALVAVGERADAAAGDPTLVGGQTVAPFAGNLEPAVASNGTDTLVVWERASGQGGLADIYGRITSVDTSEIGPAFRISLKVDDEFAPDVAWSGSSWLVVWEAIDGSGNSRVRGRRVSAAGALQGTELQFAPQGGQSMAPAVAAGPNGQLLVAWSDLRNDATTGADIYGRRVGAGGGLLDGTGVRLSTDSTNYLTDDFGIDIAWNGSIYLVVWEALDLWREGESVVSIESGGLRSSGQFEYTGLVFSGAIGSRSYNPGDPAVAASGRFFVVVFSYEEPPTGNVNILAIRYDATDRPPDPIPVSRAAGTQDQPTIAFNGHFMVVWSDRRDGDVDLWGTRISSQGTVLDPSGVLLVQEHPSNEYAAITKASSTAGTFTVAWDAMPAGGLTGVRASGIEPAPK